MIQEPARREVQKPARSTGERKIPSTAARHGPQEMVRDRRRVRRIIGVIALLLCLAISAYALITGRLLLMGISLVALAIVERTVLPIMKHLFRRQQQAQRGADGESKVAEVLSRDPDNILVLHNVSGPHGDLDHVVVRRNGAVIVLDTKSHPGRVTEAQGRLQLNGRPFEKNILNQARGNAMWLKEQMQNRLELTPFVHACLVFSNAYVLVRRPVRGVEVANLSYLPKFLARLPTDRRIQEMVQRDPERVRTAVSGNGSH